VQPALKDIAIKSVSTTAELSIDNDGLFVYKSALFILK